MIQLPSIPVFPSGRQQAYCAPEAELVLIRNERSFLQSVDHDGDHEHTEEEDLF